MIGKLHNFRWPCSVCYLLVGLLTVISFCSFECQFEHTCKKYMYKHAIYILRSRPGRSPSAVKSYKSISAGKSSRQDACSYLQIDGITKLKCLLPFMGGWGTERKQKTFVPKFDEYLGNL